MTTRENLKGHFLKGAIPTASHFADLIDSMLNQEDDGISKPGDDPLSIKAFGDDEGLINFYRVTDGAIETTWQFKQKPGDESDRKTGLSIHEAAAAPSRLFIESGTGNVGIGTTEPGAKLQVSGGAIMPATGNTKTSGIYFPPDAFGGGGDEAWIRYYARSGEATTFEIGTANDGDDHIALMPKNGNVGIGTTTPGEKLDVSGNINVSGKVKENGSDLLPTGVIIMWSGTVENVPTGWALCDGNNSTPNLTDRFIMGTNGTNVGQYGEADAHVHTVNPPSTNTNYAGSHTHKFPSHWYNRSFSGGSHTGIDVKSQPITEEITQSAGSHRHSLNIAEFQTGEESFKRPKWWAMCFIMKV